MEAIHNFLKSKKFKDIILNIIASGIITAGLQIVVYPLLAKSNSSADYGVILTVMGICNTISVTFGNALNNTRLIQNTRYQDRDVKGDFNFLLVTAVFVSLVICYFFSAAITKNKLASYILSVSCAFAVVRVYFSVSFRLKLNFSLILKSNCLTALGYILGSFLALAGLPWPSVFLFGEVVGASYTVFSSGYLSEKLHKTELFSDTVKSYLFLISSTLIGNIVVYLDRLFLYPIMGSEAVSIYSVAAVFGKAFGILMSPIAGVILSYYAQSDYGMTRKKYYHQAKIMCLMTAVFTLIAAPISPFITRLLYPTIYDSAARYILIANTASIIAVLSNMLSPAIMKFVETYWQVVITVVYGVIYIISALILVKYSGLFGFCIASLISNTSKSLLLLILGRRIKE